MDINNTEIVTKVATGLIEDAIKCSWEKVKKWFKDIDAKDSVRYGDAYEQYLDNTYRKYSKIKTIIYRRSPRNLYDFYECIGVRYEGKTIDTSTINNLLEIGKKIIITGTGGTGKSILFKHLYLDTIMSTGYIPVMIELRSFNSFEIKSGAIEETIYNTLVENGFPLEREYYEYSMREGGYVILLDGFDELNRDKSTRLSSEIKSLSDKYRENCYLISSRPSEQFIGWNDFLETETKPLSKQQAISLVDKIDFDESVKAIFCKELENVLFDKYKSFSENPLLLNIMLLTFNNNAAIPDKLNDFYDQAFATLFNMHDATKDAYVRDIRTQLGCDDFKLVFSYICFKSYFYSEYEFTEMRMREYISMAKEKYSQFRFTVDEFLDDLVSSVCMIIKDGLHYHFAHRSFQEYFAAWYTCKLTDNIQSKLLSNWLKESDTVITDLYFNMLFNMQSEKVNKIVFAPILGQIKKKYTDLGFTIVFLKSLFHGVILKTYRHDGGMRKSLSLAIKDKQKCYTLKLTCILNGYGFPPANAEAEEKVFDSFKKNGIVMGGTVPFDTALKYVSDNNLLEALKWFDNQIAFIVSILERNKESGIGQKKKVSSILDEL